MCPACRLERRLAVASKAFFCRVFNSLSLRYAEVRGWRLVYGLALLLTCHPFSRTVGAITAYVLPRRTANSGALRPQGAFLFLTVYPQSDRQMWSHRGENPVRLRFRNGNFVSLPIGKVHSTPISMIEKHMAAMARTIPISS